MLLYNSMYHALFDMEDFHGLHPVKINNKYYLEFSGHTALDREIHRNDFEDFLRKWHEMYQKYLPASTDTKMEKERKVAEYAIWRYEYPKSSAEKTAMEMRNRMKMNRLQTEIDALKADMQSADEQNRTEI